MYVQKSQEVVYGLDKMPIPPTETWRILVKAFDKKSIPPDDTGVVEGDRQWLRREVVNSARSPSRPMN